MSKSLNLAVAATLLASPALAGGIGSTVNISTTSSSVESDRITEVEVDGVGTYQFPDPFLAPELSQQSTAIETALSELGLPMGTTATAQGTLVIGSDETFVETVMSNYNPVDNPDYVIGDPEDYFTWIAIGDEDVNVFVEQTTTYYTFHRLLAGITETTTTTSTTTTSTTSTTLPSGACPPTPETGCAVATSASLQVSTGSTPAKNKLKWKLGGGSLAVEQADLGDPAASTSWTLCIYDSTLDVPFLAGSLTIGPSASLWASKDPKGWKYKDKAGSQDGVTGAMLKPGLAGKPKAQLKAAGTGLPLPSPIDTTNYFDQDSAVTVQLVKDGGPGDGLCWTSEFAAADTKSNTPDKFKATAK